MEFSHSIAYGAVNNGVHRQAADLVGAPAFIWHLGLWNAPGLFSSADARAKALEAFIKNVRSKAESASKGECQSSPREIRIRANERIKIITLRFPWKELHAKIRFEVHTEYITITSIIDLALKQFEGAEPTEPLAVEVKSVLDDFVKLAGVPEMAGSPAIRSLQDIFQYVYYDFWTNNLFKDILDVSGPSVGERFADFRGFVTGEQYPSVGTEEDEDIRGRDRLEKQAIQAPFYRTKEGERGVWHRTADS